MAELVPRWQWTVADVAKLDHAANITSEERGRARNLVNALALPLGDSLTLQLEDRIAAELAEYRRDVWRFAVNAIGRLCGDASSGEAWDALRSANSERFGGRD